MVGLSLSDAPALAATAGVIPVGARSSAATSQVVGQAPQAGTRVGPGRTHRRSGGDTGPAAA